MDRWDFSLYRNGISSIKTKLIKNVDIVTRTMLKIFSVLFQTRSFELRYQSFKVTSLLQYCANLQTLVCLKNLNEGDR